MPRSSCSYCVRSFSASAFRSSAALNSAAIALRRCSSRPSSGLNAHLFRPQTNTRNPRIWVTTIFGSIRFTRRLLADEQCAGCTGHNRSSNGFPRLLNLWREKEHGDERVDRERFGECRDDDHGELDLAVRLGLTADRLHRALSDQTETDTRADRRDADAERESECQRCLEVQD